MFRRKRILFILAGSLVGLLSIAQPALGFTKLNTTGTVGAYKVLDSQAFPGGLCTYDYSSANQAWKLKHIHVGPPRMKAVPGMGTEKVGWQFTIQRREIGFGGPGPWENRYTSPTFTASTDSTHNAPFNAWEGVKVIVPFQIGADASAEYRAKAKLIWYKANGTGVLGSVTGRIDWYYYDSRKSHEVPTTCSDYDV
jgi:hypothetical protein